MRYALDTNVLVYAADRASVHHDRARALRDRAAAEADAVALPFPVLLEFYAIITDSKRVHSPLSPSQAWQQVALYHDTFTVLYPDEETWRILGQLVAEEHVHGQHIFDAQVAALLLRHGVKTLYTANTKDLARFHDLEVRPLHDPEQEM